MGMVRENGLPERACQKGLARTLFAQESLAVAVYIAPVNTISALLPPPLLDCPLPSFPFPLPLKSFPFPLPPFSPLNFFALVSSLKCACSHGTSKLGEPSPQACCDAFATGSCPHCPSEISVPSGWLIHPQHRHHPPADPSVNQGW